MAPPSSTPTTGASADPAPPERARRRRIVLATVALSVLWPLLQVAAYGSFDALLNVGVDGPGRAQITEDVPDLALTDDIGHDGQLFYLVARHPLDPLAVEDSVRPVAYRYRRILFPAVGALLAPGGGRPLIAVFLVESLVGVALGAWALSRLPGAPRWLPLTMALTPGVIAALGMSLSDALAAGLALLAVALAAERRWLPMVGILVLAGLTRETTLLVAAGLALTPGLPRAWRVATVAVPGAVFAAWSAFSAHLADASVTAGGPDQLSPPFVGWASDHVGTTDLLLGLATMALLAGGAWRARTRLPHVAAILLLGLALMASLSELVTFNWVNSARPVAPMVPLAFWALFATDARPGAPDDEVAQDTGTTPTTASATSGP